MTVTIDVTRIRSLIERREWDGIQQLLKGWPPAAVVDIMYQLHKMERVLFFRALSRSQASKVFAHLNRADQDALLRELTDSETQQLLADLPPDDRVALLSSLPDSVTRRLLNLLNEADLEEVRWLLGYPEESVGRLMTPDFVAVRPDWTVEQAITHIRKVGWDSETVNHIYVTGTDGTLLGDVRLRQLLLAGAEQQIDVIMNRATATLEAQADQEEAVRMIKRYDQYALPVVGDDNHLLGIVTVDDLMDVEEREVTEDFHKQAGEGISADEHAYSEALLDSSIWKVLRLRLPWLLVALVGGLFAGVVMERFEETLAAVVALAFFIPLIMDMGGNVGTQSSTIFVRGLSVGQIQRDNIKEQLFREVLTGLATGVIIGALAGLVAFIWQGIFELGLVIFLSMVTVCTLASLIGYGIPWLAHKLNRDPATVSAPFITTIKDVTALAVYFALANWLLSALL
jgi:magnesium transporter